MHASPGRSWRWTTAVVTALLATGLLAAASPAIAAGPATVDLGRAASFAILAGNGVADAGPSHVTGDVGAYPRAAVASLLDTAANGKVHRGGEAAQLAQADLAVAYDLTSRLAPTGARIGGDLAGHTVPGGVYALAATAPGLDGDLVLDAAGDPASTWLFRAPSDLVIAPGSTVTLVNGAQACHVFWQVGGAATIGADAVLVGTFLATGPVTMGSGVALDGRVLAITGRVSLGGDTIVMPACADGVAPAPARAVATAPPTSTAVDATSGRDGRTPTALPWLAIGALLLAAVFGEPRRGRRPAPGDRW